MKIIPVKKNVVRSVLIPLLILLFFGILVFLAVFNLRVTSKGYLAGLIEHDISALKVIFERIDKECKILSFDYQKNRINFLNVTSFVGSEVGPMNLAYPDKWEGPYLDDNPTYQDKEYLVVRTKRGYFITPGEGVKLPNGSIIGTDIILDEDADIAVMMTDEKQLSYDGNPLAVHLDIYIAQQMVYPILPFEQII